MPSGAPDACDQDPIIVFGNVFVEVFAARAAAAREKRALLEHKRPPIAARWWCSAAPRRMILVHAALDPRGMNRT